MKIAPFAIERYFAKYEFTAQYLLSSSDCESFSLSEVLEMADAGTNANYYIYLLVILNIFKPKNSNLGTLDNSIAGILGGGIGGQLLGTFPNPTKLYPVKCFAESERSGFNRGNKPKTQSFSKTPLKNFKASRMVGIK